MHKKQKKEIKRKQKRKALKMQNTVIAIERRRENKQKRAEYKQMVENNKKAINKKLKEALGIPEHEEVSTEKLVKAINYRSQQEKKKREAEERAKQK
jgi:isopentenyldiphosphate isomerase